MYNPNVLQKTTSGHKGSARARSSNLIMFLKDDLENRYIEEFNKLGITNEDDIITILNGLDEIAEIGYVWYKNNKVKTEDIYD